MGSTAKVELTTVANCHSSFHRLALHWPCITDSGLSTFGLNGLRPLGWSPPPVLLWECSTFTFTGSAVVLSSTQLKSRGQCAKVYSSQLSFKKCRFSGPHHNYYDCPVDMVVTIVLHNVCCTITQQTSSLYGYESVHDGSGGCLRVNSELPC